MKLPRGCIKATMREFDASCLTAVEALSAKEITAIRNQPGRVRALPQRETKAGQRVGTRRETAEPTVAQAVVVKSKLLDAIA
jgi:hypothetical protein